MTPGLVAGRAPTRSEFVLAATLGLYASLIALAPSPAYAIALASPLIAIPLVWWTMLGPARWISLFFGCALLLPPLPVAIGDSGPHPALAIAAVGLLIGLIRAVDWRVITGGVELSLLVFIAALVLSVGFALLYSGPLIAAGSLARVLLFAISAYVFFFVVAGPGRDSDALPQSKILFRIAVLSALFACVDFYFQLPAPAGYGPQFVWLDSGVFRRAQGLFYEASTLGNFCAFFIAMIAVALFRPRPERPCSRPVLFAGAVVFAAALIFSYSRASLLNVAAAMIALAYLRGLRMRRIAVALLVCFTLGGAIVYVAFPAFAHNYWLRLSASFEYFGSAPEQVLSGRLSSWTTLIQFLQTHPLYWLFGIGYKTLPYSDFLGGKIVADNMYLSLLVETGIIGLAAFITLNIAILRSALRAARHVNPRAAFFGSWIFCFWVGQMIQMLSGDLFTYWRVLPLYFWVLAIAVRETRRTVPA